MSSSGVTISGDNMSTSRNIQQQPYNQQPKHSSPYFQQLIGHSHTPEGITNDKKAAHLAQHKHNTVLVNQYVGGDIRETTVVPPPIPPPPIITPTNSSQGPSWC